MGEVIKTKVKGQYTLEEIKETVTYDEVVKGEKGDAKATDANVDGWN